MLSINDWDYVEWFYQADSDYEFINLGYMGNVSDAIDVNWSQSSVIGFYTWVDQVQILPLIGDLFPLLQDEIVICNGDTVELIVDSNFPVTWLNYNHLYLESGNSYDASPSTTRNYYVEYGIEGSHTYLDSIMVIVADCDCENEGEFSYNSEDNDICSNEEVGDGSIEITSSSNLNDYTFYWNDSEYQNTSTATNLEGGEYICIIMDSNNCVDTVSAVVEELTPVDYSFDIDHTTCISCEDGSVTLNISNGSPPYTYLWANGGTSETIENLNQGWYSVDFSDASACMYTDSVEILHQDTCTSLGVLVTDYNDLTCNSPANISTNAFGGIQPYSYSWDSNPPVFSSSLITDSSGVFALDVIDAIGCTQSTFILVNGNDDVGFDMDANLITEPFRTWSYSNITIDAYNNGCLLTEGTITLVLDPLISFYDTINLPDEILGDTLIWYYDETNNDFPNIVLSFNTLSDSLAVIGDTVCFDLSISPISDDLDTTNNFKHYCYPIVNSYDPNDKKVYPLGICDGHFVLKTEPLTYTIRFQNTGNAEAFNVHIIDSLSSFLDINTVEILGSSHDMYTLIRPGNVLDFMFDDIFLPDSTSNEAESHGYVIFKVYPNSFIYNGTFVDNKSEIYFDYNDAIVTNTVFNTLVNVLLTCDIGMGIDEDHSVVSDVLIYPNPSKGAITVDFGSLKDVDLNMYNLSGQLIYSQQKIMTDTHQFEVDEPAGIYILEISTTNGNQYYKVVLE